MPELTVKVPEWVMGLIVSVGGSQRGGGRSEKGTHVVLPGCQPTPTTKSFWVFQLTENWFVPGV